VQCINRHFLPEAYDLCNSIMETESEWLELSNRCSERYILQIRALILLY
jgi:hypothetical protein